VNADEIWAANASPHLVAATLRIRGGATVSIEPCAEVQMASGAGIHVGSTSEAGALSALGTVDQPIRIARRDAEPWEAILVQAPGAASLAHVTIEGGGSSAITYDGASVVLWGDSTPPLDPLLRVDQVSVRGSAGLGILVGRGGGFAPGSTGLTVTGSGAAAGADLRPIALPPEALGTLPDGIYTGWLQAAPPSTPT
jgi:hypothetical protein